MASIYANAYFTIIALDGKDANQGLDGVTCSAAGASCRYPQTIFRFPGQAEALVSLPKENYSIPWHKRGWTFQERVVSPRCLMFQGGTVFWQCRQAKWWEEVAAEPEDIPQANCWFREVIGTRYTLTIDSWPNASCYWDLVGAYTKRTLTFEADAPRAFTAILDVMSRSFPGGFHWGVPAFYFDLGLCWRSDLPLRRRDGLPSWSWLGWKGEIEHGYSHRVYYPNFGVFGSTSRNQLHTTVNKWYACKDPHAGNRTEIDNAWGAYYALKRKPANDLPWGWSDGRKKVRKSKDDSEEDSDNRHEYGRVRLRRVFHHERLGAKRVLGYPVPSTEVPLGPFPEAWSPFLSFSTVRQRFVLDGSSLRPLQSSEYCLWMNLRCLDGTWAGVVESNTAEESEVSAMTGQECEAILVSVEVVKRRSKRYRHHREMDICDAIKSLPTYEFCNITMD